VLVVDDEPALTVLLARVLENVGLEVATANDGWQALAQVREHPPVVMVVDVGMPGLDGLQFIELCRAIPDCAEIPVVLMSTIHALSAAQQRIEGKGVVLLL
jgi:CheY-like chemotaxis protein